MSERSIGSLAAEIVGSKVIERATRMNAIVPIIRTRFPMPQGLDGFDDRKWRVLCETTFPSARTPEAIAMAVDYCRARGLDVFKKPVHIVPMWNSSLGREVETVWPGINEIQITAARTRAWAGMDEPKWGPNIERVFKGRKKVRGGWQDGEEQVTFPEWCAVTVYRMIGATRCPFTEPVFWLEAYSRMGGGELPTDMWVKRPRGQLQKVAKAAALRAAFPEEGEYTAEEMEGKDIEAGGIVIEETSRRSSNSEKTKPDATGQTSWEKFQHELSECETAYSVDRLRAEYEKNIYPTWPKAWPGAAEQEFTNHLAALGTGDNVGPTLHVDTETGELRTLDDWKTEIEGARTRDELEEIGARIARWTCLPVDRAALRSVYAQLYKAFPKSQGASQARDAEAPHSDSGDEPQAAPAPAEAQESAKKAQSKTRKKAEAKQEPQATKIDDPDKWLEWLKGLFRAAQTVEEADAIFTGRVEPHKAEVLPPDYDDAVAMHMRCVERLKQAEGADA